MYIELCLKLGNNIPQLLVNIGIPWVDLSKRSTVNDIPLHNVTCINNTF